MNRGIDYRSDFYALGVTFYELLTGTLPFESEDPLELIHGHNTITIKTSIVEENQLQIEVKDNDCGIKSDTQNRIFEQGFTTKGVGEGTGLGLAISYQIITEKHDGTITCNSELGKGTAFFITIPL